MATIYERMDSKGNKKYQATVRIKGYPKQVKTFDRKTDATIWANGLEADLKRGRKIETNEAMKHTVAEMIDRYLEYELPKRNTDHQKFKTHLGWWKNKIGDYLLSTINSSIIAKTRDELKKEPSNKIRKNGKIIKQQRANGTVNRYLATLSIAFTVARKEWKWINENPTSDVSKLKEPKGRIRFLSDNERDRLINSCKSLINEYSTKIQELKAVDNGLVKYQKSIKKIEKDRQRLTAVYVIVLTAMSVGARAGEVLNLKWDNVKLNDRMFYFMDTKNGENRAVPIPQLLLDLYIKHSKIRRIDSQFVFPNFKGDNPMETKWFWHKLRDKAKLEDFRFHDLRHTAASELAMNGASLLDIAAILGHKTMQMTKRYSHLTKQHTATILDSMNEKQFKNIEL